ncbi:MAG: apolipoprotein N-acyltransferase [Acidimicrobiia bacterium]
MHKIKLSSKARHICLALLAGLGLALSQEPYRLWPLVFLSVIYLLRLIDKFVVTNEKIYLRSFVLAWCTYSIILCKWISYFGSIALIAFTFSQIIISTGFVYLIKFIKPNKYKALIYSFCWVAFEYVQSHLGIFSFTWTSFSTTLISSPFSRLARTGGGALLSFTVVFISGLIAFGVRNRSLINVKFIINSFLLITLSIAAFSVSSIRTNSTNKTKSIYVIQANDKNRYLTQREINNDLIAKQHLEVASKMNNRADIIIFPESAFDEEPNYYQKDLKNVAKKANDLMILNTNSNINGFKYNTNYYFNNRFDYLGSYSKKRLVPFGEYVPLDKWIGSWKVFDPIGNGFKPGKKDITINGVTTLICYESTFTQDVRNALKTNSHLLVITTNNRSYRKSGNSKQHLAQSRLRAIEYGISTVHASISGPSALIERDGKVISSSKMFKKALLSGNLSWGRADSIYYVTRDWLSQLSVFVVLCIGLLNLRKFEWKSQTSKKLKKL